MSADSAQLSQLMELLNNGNIDSDRYDSAIASLATKADITGLLPWQIEMNNRAERARCLIETDHWAYQDTADMTSAQIAYRQALRDLPTHANWPDLEDADWPNKPE